MIYSIDYSSGYSEGDNPSSVPSTVTSLEMQILNDKLDLLLQNCENLATKSYIDSKIPFVDDMSLKAFKAGDIVDVVGLDDIPCIVESSSMLPIDLTNFIIVYTVSYVKDNIKYVSNFPSGHVSLHKV